MPSRHVVHLALLLLVGVGCTGEGPIPGPTAAPSSPGVTAPPLVLDVVAATQSVAPLEPRYHVSYVDGMRLAVEDVNAAGGVDGRSLEIRQHQLGGTTRRTAEVLEEALDQHALAILYVGQGAALTSLRQRFAEMGTPVVLLSGDLYTRGGLFPQVFQTSIPWVWQAHVIARYLVRDRHARRVAFLGEGRDAAGAGQVLRSALEYWGGVDSFLDGPSLEKAVQSDWIVTDAPPGRERELANALEEVAPARRTDGPRTIVPGLTGSSSLLAPDPNLAGPEPGTSACYTYTWAGWAEPIPRVGDFIRHFRESFGHNPVGFEQEGYDAVRTLALALDRTGGRGGSALVGALEGIHRTFSSFPVDLGPDDHVFLPRDELGLFAVPGPNEKLDPWQGAGGEVWRALMRTFTYDGERDNLTDRDRPVFFPGWEAPQPGPKYWKSRYGITTRPSDPLH